MYKFAILFISTSVFFHTLSGQCLRVSEPPSDAECCLILSAFPFIAATYRISGLYGFAENEQLGTGHTFGGELSWFPVQAPPKEMMPILIGLKIGFNNTGEYGETKPYMSAFIETDFYFRKKADEGFHFFNPYIGFDFGLTEGFIQSDKTNFAIAPIIGGTFNLNDVYSIYCSARYLKIFENPQSQAVFFNLGLQINTTELL